MLQESADSDQDRPSTNVLTVPCSPGVTVSPEGQESVSPQSHLIGLQLQTGGEHSETGHQHEPQVVCT